MAYVLDTVTTASYQYLECPGTRRVTLQVSNNAAYIGFGENPTGRRGAGVYPPADEPFLPVTGPLQRTCDEIRVKSYNPANPANVKIVALP